MTGIDPARLTTPWVNVAEGAHTTDLLRELARLSTEERRQAVIIVTRDDGSFLTFSYTELARAIAERDGDVIQLPLAGTLARIAHVVTPAVERTTLGIGEAQDRQRAAPRRRLIVLEGAVPVGLLADQLMGGQDFDVSDVDNRLFAQAAAVEAEPPSDAPRWLSARVHAGLEQRRRSFKAGAVHTLTVGIAPAERDLIQADEPFPHQVPAGEVHTMDVVLWAPGLLDAPRWSTFDLPHDGPTVEPATFELPVPEQAERVEATIAVLYRNRMIQAATLQGPVVDGADDDASADSRIELRKAPAASVDLSVLRPFNATILVNGEDVLVRVGDAARAFTMDGIQASVNLIQTRLYTTAAAAARTGGGLGAAPIRELLHVLAYHGHAVYRELTRDAIAPTAGARTIEVTVRNAGDFFPVELVYERGRPGNDPQICPNWEAAFAAGMPCPDCPATGDGARYVCPLGFWGLSKEIARRIDPDLDDGRLATVRPSGPSAGRMHLESLQGVLIGASVKVDAGGGASQIEATITLAERLFPGRVVRADDWNAWTAAVRANAPSLLLGMPHTDVDRLLGVEVLRIGDGSDLDPLSVGDEHVQSPQGEVGPIVLLLGCNTDAPAVGYLGFVPLFLQHHAAVVVGTVAKVLGRHTGPVARQFVEEVVAAQGSDIPLSEVMRRVRGAMLREGNVMGLTLTAYGNADWLLAA